MSAKFKDDVASAVAAAVSEIPVQRRAGLRILIVEDNHFVARQAESVLAEAGYEIVYIVATADDAVRLALDRRPQFVLVDIYLPGKRDDVDVQSRSSSIAASVASSPRRQRIRRGGPRGDRAALGVAAYAFQCEDTARHSQSRMWNAPPIRRRC